MTGLRDQSTALAWQTAAFFGAAQAGKLKELSHYLSDRKPKQAQSEEEIERGIDRYFNAYEAHQKARSDG
jgi:hypothetical protein